MTAGPHAWARWNASALLVVDLQPDFLPGGPLGVPEGGAVLAPIAALLDSGRFGLCVATQDWHPPGHASFASAHPGRDVREVVTLHGRDQVLWPDHCVQGTPGAALAPGLPWERVEAVIRKGTAPTTDSYSAFRNNWDARGERPPTGLAGYLRERGIEDVVLCGLTRDYCALWSAEDAVAAGFQVTFLWELTRPVDPGSDDVVRRRLAACGAAVATGTEF